MENINGVKMFYENLYDEDSRTTRNPLEFVRTKEIISRYLTTDNMNIADIGGATGAYSFWLVSLGHQIHLLDFTEKHIRQANEKSKQSQIKLASLTCADARSLPYDNESFDMVLEMGALYHLQESRDRKTCLSEAFRVLKKNSTVICAVITRYASLIDGFKFSFVDDSDFVDIIRRDLETGKHINTDETKPYFTSAFFHTPSLIKEELQTAGFREIKLIAVEGFSYMLNIDEYMKNERKKSLLLEFLSKTETVQELMGCSSHILAIGKK